MWKIRGVNFKPKYTTCWFFSIDGLIYSSDLAFLRRLTFKSITFVVRVIQSMGFDVTGKYNSQKGCILQIEVLQEK